MITPMLNKVLGDSVMRAIAGSVATVYRHTLTSDGRGGQTETWRPIATFPARFRNNADNEQMIGDSLQSISKWTMLCDRNADVMVHDRVRTDAIPGYYWEVSGTDFGQTNLIIQHVDMVQYGDGEWL